MNVYDHTEQETCPYKQTANEPNRYLITGIVIVIVGMLVWIWA